MTATVTELRPGPAYYADGATIRTRDGLAISIPTADALLIEHLRETHDALERGQPNAALALVRRADALLAARVAVTLALLSQQPTPPSAA